MSQFYIAFSIRVMNILLHICCGPCAGHCIEELRKEGNVLGLFYNPNIHPREEYERRKENARSICDALGIELIEADYDVSAWFNAVTGLEGEPEGGTRCEVCFRMRLERAVEIASSLGCNDFTTTLTVSPRKNAEVIHHVGDEVSERYGVRFRHDIFRKKDGFKKSMDIARKHGLYRQNYCGCIFSKKT